MKRTRSQRKSRRGATAVEFAMVSPLIFAFVFASVEFGRAQMVLHNMAGAAMEGARAAIVADATLAEVESAAAEIMDAAGITTYTLTVTPTAFGEANQWDPITVSIDLNYNDVGLLPLPIYLNGVNLQRRCTLPREAEAS